MLPLNHPLLNSMYRIDQCRAEAGCFADSSRPYYFEKIQSMAEDTGKDYVQVCRALRGHAERAVCEGWAHSVSYHMSASEC